MVRNTADAVERAAGVTCNRGQIGMEWRPGFSVQIRHSILCREDDMDQGECVGFRHEESIDRAFGPCLLTYDRMLRVPRSHAIKPEGQRPASYQPGAKPQEKEHIIAFPNPPG